MLIDLAPSDRSANGVNMPDIKMRGNRISAESIITLEGTLPAGADRSTPKAAKQRLPRKKRTGRTRIVARGREIDRNVAPTRKIMALMMMPNKVPASVSPSTSVGMLTGRVSSRSKVPDCFSQGMINGPTEEAVKNMVMARKPGKYLDTSSCRPTKKAKKRNVGRMRPKMNTGAFL